MKLRKMPAIKDRQKYKRILDGVIRLLLILTQPLKPCEDIVDEAGEEIIVN